MELPIALLWKETTQFYGSFDVLLGYREAIEQIGTIEGVRGRLFIFDDCCYFGVPNSFRRAGQFSVLFQLQLDLLQVKKSKLQSTHTLLFGIPHTLELCIM